MLLLLVCLLGHFLSTCMAACRGEICEFQEHLTKFDSLTKNHKEDIFLKTPMTSKVCQCARITLKHTLRDLELLQKRFEGQAYQLLALMQANLERIMTRIKDGQGHKPANCQFKELGVKTAKIFFLNFFGALTEEGCAKED